MQLSYSHDPAVLDRVLPLILDLEKGANGSRGLDNEDDSGTMVNGQELDFEKMLEGVRGADLSADIRVDPRIITPLKRYVPRPSTFAWTPKYAIQNRAH